jgi:hypothetical protein
MLQKIFINKNHHLVSNGHLCQLHRGKKWLLNCFIASECKGTKFLLLFFLLIGICELCLTKVKQLILQLLVGWYFLLRNI